MRTVLAFCTVILLIMFKGRVIRRLLRNHRVGKYKASQFPEINKLRDNLINTEVDVVLESPDSLFIGEVKDVSDFGADSRYVLVHQLIRQYVTATILIENY